MSEHITDFTLSALAQDRLSGINAMMQSIGKAFGACACVLWELTPGVSPNKRSTEEFLFGLAHWPLDAHVPSFKTPARFVTSEVARTQETRNVPDVTSDPHVLQTDFLKSLRAKTMCSVPVRFLDGSLGALNVYKNVPAPLTGQEIQQLENFARLVPPFYQTIRDKVSFKLLQQVNTVLDEAERQAAQIPLTLEQIKIVQSESIEKTLKQKFLNAEIVPLDTESQFYSYLDELAVNPTLSRPDIAIIDAMVRWENPSENMRKPPKEVSQEGFHRAGVRCVKKLLARQETKGIGIILYSILEKEDLAQELNNLPGKISFVTKKEDLDELIEKIYSILRWKA